MRAYAAVLLTGCFGSSTAGIIQHPLAHDLGGSFDARAGAGGIVGTTLVADLDARLDLGHDNNRLAFGAGLTGGYPLFGRTRVLGRAGIFATPLSSVAENSVTPTFELAVYIPSDESAPDSVSSRYGWHSSGLTFGVREDLDVIPYTTVFVGGTLFFIPGY